MRWHRGATAATRFRIQASADGRTWTTVRTGVSSGETAGWETYDMAVRHTRFVRVAGVTGRPDAVVVRD